MRLNHQLRLATVCATASVLVALLSSAPSQRSPRSGADLIRTQDLQSDLFFLSADDLEGRQAGTQGDHVASDYVAAQFMRLGMKPVGDGGTYFQNMSLIYGNLDREHTTLTGTIAGTQQTFAFGRDFSWVRSSIRNATGCGQIVFAGYGINAPEYGYNDLAGVNVKGKVAMILSREPQANDPNSKFMGTWDTYHAFSWEKLELMRKAGVAGLLIIEGGPGRGTRQTPASSPRARGGPEIALAGQMWDLPVFSISRSVADKLLGPSGRFTDRLQADIDRTATPNSFDVPQSSACLTKAFTGVETHQGRNVVGLIEGSDPQLREQSILVSAHHDHMGDNSGRIYHGADDNASGTAAVMRIAQAFVEGDVRPKRSILFIVYDGEERIFLGSYYYITHPLVPLDHTVAEFNMDMIGRDQNDPNWPVPADGNTNMVNVLGTRYNPTLSRILDQANRVEGLKLEHDMDVIDPDSLWSRSDHFWMATLHIPQVELQTGLHPDYHTENDTWQRINYLKYTRITRLVFLAVSQLAGSGEKIPFIPEGVPAPATAVSEVGGYGR